MQAVNAKLNLFSSCGDEADSPIEIGCRYSFYDDGLAEICYTDNEKRSVTIRISPDCAVVSRFSDYNGKELEIEVVAGVKTTGFIKTPYGDIELETLGRSVSSELCRSGGEAGFSYYNGNEVSVKLAVSPVSLLD